MGKSAITNGPYKDASGKSILGPDSNSEVNKSEVLVRRGEKGFQGKA